MADNEETETKEKRTVPGLERTFPGIIEHADKLLPLVFDKERNALKDPKLAIAALFGYVKSMAALTGEAEARIDARLTALEVRTEKLEQQIAAFESWRADVEKQSAEMAKSFEEMMTGDPVAKLKEALEARNAPAELPAPPTPLPTIIDAKELDTQSDVEAPSTVVPLKTNHDRVEKNGGAA